VTAPRHRRGGLPRAERGAITLVVAAILLIGVTMTLIHTANTAVLEQTLSANEVRARQAAAAAQAGLEQALSATEAGPDTIFTDTLANGARFRAVYWAWNPDAPTAPPGLPTACPPGATEAFVNEALARPEALDGNFRILSCGWSDDGSAQSVALVGATAIPVAGPAAETAPLVVKGAVDTSGSGRVFNCFSNLTIWSGAGAAVSGKAGSTFVRHPELPTPEPDPATALPERPSHCNPAESLTSTPAYLCTTRGDQAGPDVILADPTLANLSPEQFFEAFAGAPRGPADDPGALFREIHAPARHPAQLPNLNGVQGQVIWVDGDLDLEQGEHIGTRTRPVFLVVGGDAHIHGNLRFHGILYVLGDLITTGNPEFIGSTAVEGRVTHRDGAPSFVFDPVALGAVRAMSPRGIVAGTWRDWL
jgi:hypothetical protein